MEKWVMTSDFFINIFSEVIIVFKCMFLVFRPALDVVKEGRIFQTGIFPDLLYINFWTVLEPRSFLAD